MGVGTLSIIGGTVQVSGDVIENNAPDGNGSSTINIQYGTSMLDMMPPGATVPGNITVDTLKITSGSVVNYGTLSLTNLIFASPTTGFSLNTGQALAPARRGVVGTLTVGGYLTLNSATLAFDLNTPGTSDFIRVTNTLTLNSLNSVEVSAATGGVATGTYTLISAASIVGDASNLQVTGDLVDSRYTSVFDTTSLANSVRLIVSGSPSSLTWSGDGAANLWNLKTDANWNSQTEQFFEFDSVTFNDSSTNLTINLDGTLQAGSVTMASAKNYTLAGSGKLSSVLTQTGAGTLTLAAGSTFVGPVNVNAGTLSANGTVGYAPVTVASGGTLAGSGAVLGPVTVQSGGTLSPSGALALSNNLVLAGGSTTVFKANLTTASQDQVTGLAAVTYGGTLNLVLSGRAVTTNDTFKLFSLGAPLYPQFSPYTGVFTSIVPTTPGLGLGWSTNTLTSDGTLRVIQVVNKTPTNMTAQVSGNQLTLSWPADRIGWRLQGQTNAPSVGLWTNWVDVPNTATNNSYTVTINPTNGSAFYRMVYP
jgi:autotransporter-associated beta strand protein